MLPNCKPNLKNPPLKAKDNPAKIKIPVSTLKKIKSKSAPVKMLAGRTNNNNKQSKLSKKKLMISRATRSQDCRIKANLLFLKVLDSLRKRKTLLVIVFHMGSKK